PTHSVFSTAPPPTYISPLSLHDALPILLIATPPPAVAYPQVAGSDRTSTSSLCALEQTSRLRQRRERYRLHPLRERVPLRTGVEDRKSTRLNSSHVKISYAVFCLKKKKT